MRAAMSADLRVGRLVGLKVGCSVEWRAAAWDCEKVAWWAAWLGPSSGEMSELLLAVRWVPL